MIGHLTGKIIHSDLKSVVLDVAGVGYKIHTNTAVLAKPISEKSVALGRSDSPGLARPAENGFRESKTGEVADFWTYLAVRENALDLYGFQKKEELDFFELLLTVSGIGPKSAMGILSIASLSNLRQAISTGDSSHLVKVSGVGKKNAEKIVLELKDKLENFGSMTGDDISLSGDMDALEAMKSLGYTERESREALKKADGKNTEEKIRSALKNLNK